MVIGQSLKSPLLAKFVAQIKAGIIEINNHELLTKIEKQEPFLLLDVRPEKSWAEGHITNAINCDRGMLEINIEKIAPNVNQEIIIYCGGGTRSALSAETLQRMGYKNVKSLATGFRGWAKENLPVV